MDEHGAVGLQDEQPHRLGQDGGQAARVPDFAAGDEAELFLYPGEQHLFADSSLPAYDAAAAALLTERVLAFLETVQTHEKS